MSTATMPRVRSVTAASTAAGSMFRVTGSTSANTGVAPSTMKQFAEATNDSGEVITSSPGPSPAILHMRCSPAVPLETAAAYGAPTRSAICSSNFSIHGPSESRPDRRTSRTSSSSRSSSHGRESRELSPGIGVSPIASLGRLGSSASPSFVMPQQLPSILLRTPASATSARSCRGPCRGTRSGSSA